ncbi:MAG: MazG nucleotide pyrophosphohydrolase domain-containing protein [Rhizomicrobium sp.]
MRDLPERPTLADFQAFVVALETERGFNRQTPVEKCLLMGEEVGELFKAVRKAEGIAIEPGAKVGGIGEELSDILVYLCSIANRYGVDLETAFREKEARNKTRTWR